MSLCSELDLFGKYKFTFLNIFVKIPTAKTQIFCYLAAILFDYIPDYVKNTDDIWYTAKKLENVILVEKGIGLLSYVKIWTPAGFTGWQQRAVESEYM